MERKIGEIFFDGNSKMQCVRATSGCSGCAFGSYGVCCVPFETFGSCGSFFRSDKTDVIFKQLN